jgi:parallel beta-helix repeat protein
MLSSILWHVTKLIFSRMLITSQPVRVFFSQKKKTISFFALLFALLFTGVHIIYADPATPITDCGEITVSGAYAVQNDISSSGPCIVISANNVSIDGGNFTITGTSSSGDYGIATEGATGVVISNIALVNQGIGIFLSAAPAASITDVAIGGSVQNGIVLSQSADASVSESTINGTFYYTAGEGYGINIIDSTGVEITGNDFGSNDLTAIGMFGANGNATITGNTISNSNNSSMRISACSYNDSGCDSTISGLTITGNTITNAGNSGIDLEGVITSTISTNEISNADYGIVLNNASNGNTLSGNTISDSGVGINLDESENNTISTNTITNVDTAVYIEDDSHGNIVSENEIDDVVSGFFIDASDNNQVLDNTITLSEVNYGSGSSSPLLFTWDGEGYDYVADVGRGIPRNVTGMDYVPVPSDSLVPKNGKYSINLSQEYNEIVYFDKMALMTFDHAAGYDVVTSLQRNKEGQFFTIADEPSNPMQSCTDMYGNDCLEDLQASDEKWSVKDESNLNSWIMDFGDLSGASRIQLVIQAARDYSLDSASLRTIQVKNSSGQWVDAYAGSAISSPGGSPRTQVIDLTGKFTGSSYEVKFGYDRTRVNYVAIDTSAPVSYTTNTYSPETADLQFHGYTAINKEFFWDHDWNTVSPVPEEQFAPQVGNFTKYGDVAPLLTSTDDQFVIMHHGDSMAIEFPYVAPAGGTERSFIMDNWATFKHAEMGVVGQTVDPLPFNGMTAYPYPENEEYPETSENLAYIKLWNTRTINDDRFGMSLPDSVNTIVRGNTITNDSGDPEDPFIGDKGIYVYLEESSTIEDNIISGFNYGIVVEESEDITLVGNTISDIQFDAIQVDDVLGLTISENIISDTFDGGDGIEVENSEEVTITDNTISNVTDDGIYLGNVQNVEISGNTATGVTDDGLDLEESGSYTVTNNTFESENNGIEVEGNYVAPGGNDCDDPASLCYLRNQVSNGPEKYSGTSAGWEDKTVDLASYLGQNIDLHLAFYTDGSVLGNGVYLDDIVITVDGTDVFSDDIESGTNGWTVDDPYGPSWTIEEPIDAPSASHAWYSNYEDNQYTALTRAVDLTTATSASVSYTINYDTESCCDYFGVWGAEIVDEGGGGEDDGDIKTVSDNEFTSGSVSVFIDGATNIDFLRNTFRSNSWIDNDSELNTFSNESVGNIYYLADETPAWETYNITDSDSNGYADAGDDLPFNQEVLGEELWLGLGMDEHPATETNTTVERTTKRRSIRSAIVRQFFEAAPASQVPTSSSSGSPADGQCPTDQILTQNMRSGARDGRYHQYTKAVVKEVKILQAHMNRLAFNSGPADGILGPITDGAIKRMQVFLGTMADGYVGPLTRALINKSCGAEGLKKA